MNLHRALVETLLILTGTIFPSVLAYACRDNQYEQCVRGRACACPKSEEMMDLPAIRHCFSLAHFATRH